PWASTRLRRRRNRQTTSRQKIFKLEKGKEHRNADCPLPLKTLRSFRKNMTNVNEAATTVAEVSEMPAAPQAAVEGEAAGNRPRGSGRKLRTPFRRRRGDAGQLAGQDAPGVSETEGGGESSPAPAAKRRAASKPRKTAARKRKDTVEHVDDSAHEGGRPERPESGEGAEAAAGPKGQRRARKNDAAEVDREADLALSYLERSAQLPQRLGKYLNSEALMPKLHKVLAEA